MDKLLTFSGGQPLTTGDLEFLQQCYTDILEAIGIAINTDCILWGANITDGYVGGGCVIAGNMILPFYSVPRTTERYLCFRKELQEEREFADGQLHKVREVIVPYVSDSTSGAYRYFDLERNVRFRDVLTGDAYWEDFSGCITEIQEGTTVEKLEFNNQTHAVRMSVSRTEGSSCVLFEINDNIDLDLNARCLGLAYDFNTNKPYIVTVKRKKFRIYNMDGSEYTGILSLTNTLLKKLE